jgi:NTP pyrophosphatase (non-canonical NTP hydrolase)
MDVSKLVYLFRQFQVESYEVSVEKGLWEGEQNFGEKIAMVHGELSEALEAHRNNNPPDKHCPVYSSIEVELADAILRILNLSHHFGMDVTSAMIAKHEHNKTRPHKHNKLY